MNPNYDFNPAVEKTSVELAKVILNEMNTNADKLLFEIDTNESADVKKKHDEDFTDFMISIIKITSATDIPVGYATWPLERLIGTLTILKNQIDGTVRGTEDEILSRLYAVRSPKTGKFAQDCATFGTVLSKLNELREQTGNKQDDYFTVAEEQTPKVEESPYQDEK